MRATPSHGESRGPLAGFLPLSAVAPAWSAEVTRPRPPSPPRRPTTSPASSPGWRRRPTRRSRRSPARRPGSSTRARSTAAWSRLEEARLAKIRAWSAANLTKPQPVRSLHVQRAGFPLCRRLLLGPHHLCDERPGADRPNPHHHARAAPVLWGRRWPACAPRSARRSTTASSSPQQMRAASPASRLNGVLPVLYLFLARSGKTIQDVTLMAVDKDGAVVAAGTKDATPGREDHLHRPAKGKVQTLYYFQTDLSDSGVKRSGFLKFCEQLGSADVFIKSASYLLHSDNFSHRARLPARARRRGGAGRLRHPGALLHGARTGSSSRSAATWGRSPCSRAVPEGAERRFPQDRTRRSWSSASGYRWRPQEFNLLLA